MYAVVSDDAKADVARSAGADEVVLADGFKDAVADLTSGHGVDVVVDPVGGDRFTDSLRSLAPLGRMLVIGFTAGAIPEVKVNRLLLNNVDVVGVGWGAYWTGAGGPDFVRRQWDDLVPLLESGQARPGHRDGALARRGGRGAARHRRAPCDRQDPADSLRCASSQGRGISANTGRPIVGSCRSRARSVVLREIETSSLPLASEISGCASGA